MRRTVIGSMTLGATLVVGGCAADREPSGAPTPAAPATTAVTSAPAPTSAPTSPVTGGPAASPGTVDLYDHDFPVTWQRAVETARTRFNGDVGKIELEYERGRYAYEVGLLSDTQEYSIHVDAQSGAVIEEDTDELDQDEVRTERQENRITLTQVVSPQDAMNAARRARSGRIDKWKLEGGPEGPRYEFDIDPSGAADEDYEVRIDARTGRVASSAS
jgi:uncharacterized membrane protein YkoI